MREVVRGEDSPVERCNSRVEGIRETKKEQKQVRSNQPPCDEEQSRSKNDVLHKQGSRHEKGNRL